ncbi:MAG: hypothetical protein HZB43_01030 [candidate division Zixibacteria bacterium]|nr:hypothetical protein [candidate division Zixibacteria bacterium]
MTARVILLTVLLVAAPISVRSTSAAESAVPTVGAVAPDFVLRFATRDSVSFSKLTLSTEVKKSPILRFSPPTGAVVVRRKSAHFGMVSPIWRN